MRILLLFTIVLLFRLTVLGQVRIGYTESNLRKSLAGKEISKLKHTDERFPYVKYVSKDFYWAYYFNVHGQTFYNLRIPLNQNLVDGIVKEFNKTLVKVSDTEWLSKDNGIDITIVMVYDKQKDVYMFRYTVIE